MSAFLRWVGLMGSVVALGVVVALLSAFWLPSAGVIAFQRNSIQGTTDIYAVDVGTGLTVRLTKNPQNDRLPSWSPDGESLAIQSYRPDVIPYETIYQLPFSTRDHAVPLLPADSMVAIQPEWSPDGCCVAFSAYDSGTYSNNVHIVRLGDGAVWNAAPTVGLSQFSPAWSPDGRQIAAAAGPVDGYLEQRITVFPVDTVNGRGVSQVFSVTPPNAYITPAWSADSNMVVFAQVQPGLVSGSLFRASAPIPELNGHLAHRVTRIPTPRRATYPDVSSDGEWIVFSALDTRDTRYTVLYISRSDGTDLRQLTMGEGDYRADTVPVWRPVRRTR